MSCAEALASCRAARLLQAVGPPGSLPAEHSQHQNFPNRSRKSGAEGVQRAGLEAETQSEAVLAASMAEAPGPALVAHGLVADRLPLLLLQRPLTVRPCFLPARRKACHQNEHKKRGRAALRSNAVCQTDRPTNAALLLISLTISIFQLKRGV